MTNIETAISFLKEQVGKHELLIEHFLNKGHPLNKGHFPESQMLTVLYS